MRLAAALNGVVVALLLAVLVYTVPRSIAYGRLLDENLQLKERLDDIDERMNEVDRMLLRLRLYDSQLQSLGNPRGDHGPVDTTTMEPMPTPLPGGEQGPGEPLPGEAFDGGFSDGGVFGGEEVGEGGLRSAAQWADIVAARADAFIDRMTRSEPGLTELVVELEDLRALDAALPDSWPARGMLSSGYGWRRNPIGYRGYRFHSGLDIAADRGTPILAAADGVVSKAEYNSGFGRMVELDHGYGITTIYAHCNTLLVQVGDRVASGRQIATMGSTGHSTGPHLHFEVRLDGNAVDPMDYLPRTRKR
jgi:hypothetical protein